MPFLMFSNEKGGKRMKEQLLAYLYILRSPMVLVYILDIAILLTIAVVITLIFTERSVKK